MKLIAYWFALAAPAIVIVVLALVWWKAEYLRANDSYPMKFSFIEELGEFVSRLLIADVDSDGNDDIVVNMYERLLWYRVDGDKITLGGERPYGGWGSTRAVADANGDGFLEFFVLKEIGEGYGISCYNWFSPRESLEPLYTMDISLPPLRSGPPALPAVRVKSFKQEGRDRSTILVAVNGPNRNDATCRHLYAFDGATGRELWCRDFGPMIGSYEGFDFETENPRVVLTTVASAPWLTCPGADDSLNHVYCLDGKDGRLLWKTGITNYYGNGYVVPADLNCDGEKEILVGRYIEKTDILLRKDPHAWNLAIFSREGSMRSSVCLPARPRAVIVTDLDNDSRPEIIYRSRNAPLITLNGDLTVRSMIPAPDGSPLPAMYLEGAYDFTGDGEAEMVVIGNRGLMLQDRQGKILARWKGDERISDVTVFRHKEGHRIVLLDGFINRDSPYGLSSAHAHLRVVSPLPQPAAKRFLADWRRFGVSATAIAFSAGWSAFHIRRRWRRRRERQIDILEAQSDLLAGMSAFDHGGSFLKALDRLRFHLKNWERMRPEGCAEEDLFANLLQTYREAIVPELQRLVMLARRARVPERDWERISSQATVAGKEIEEALAFGSLPVVRREERVAESLAALDALDGSIAGIRTYLRSVFRASVAEELGGSIEQFRYDRAAGGISFALDVDPSGGDAVFISPVSFGKIFESLLSNAIRATEGRPDAAIVVAVQWEGNYCRIDVRDNGCGIPREDWERVFERHYTTKKEGGFGLHYAREELAKFGGKIYVVDSVVGSGTTMRVVLRRSEKAQAV